MRLRGQCRIPEPFGAEALRAAAVLREVQHLDVGAERGAESRPPAAAFGDGGVADERDPHVLARRLARRGAARQRDRRQENADPHDTNSSPLRRQVGAVFPDEVMICEASAMSFARKRIECESVRSKIGRYARTSAGR